MFYIIALTACLFSLPRSEGAPRAGVRRYKPIIQVTEEIDINDITFTTSAPYYERSLGQNLPISHKSIKGNPIKVPETPPPSSYYGTSRSSGKVYATEQPITVPVVTQYKPYQAHKYQEEYKPSSIQIKPKDLNKIKVVHFEPKTSLSAASTPESPRKFSPNAVPLPVQYLVGKDFAKSTSYLPTEIPTFIYSPTYPPTVLAHINKETTDKYVDQVKKSIAEKEAKEWGKTKKPYYVKKSKKIMQTTKPPLENSEKSGQDTLFKDSPQSESFVSEVSTAQQGRNNLEGAPDTLHLKTGERVEFQMYGMDGPQSYKFGYDTGKGQNRHFRFEERDNTGKVKGHYGYLDEDGKMRIMKYEADPVTGFHAGPVEISPDDN